MDATANDALKAKFELKGFPTLKFFSGGKVYAYKGARNEAAFEAYLSGGYKDAESESLGTTAKVEVAKKVVVSDEDVVVLTDANFEKHTQISTGTVKGDWLIEFYAP